MNHLNRIKFTAEPRIEDDAPITNPRTVNVKSKRAARLHRKAKNRQQRHMRKLAA